MTAIGGTSAELGEELAGFFTGFLSERRVNKMLLCARDITGTP